MFFECGKCSLKQDRLYRNLEYEIYLLKMLKFKKYDSHLLLLYVLVSMVIDQYRLNRSSLQ